MIRVCGKFDKTPVSDLTIDTTSGGNGKAFSPFFLGPVVVRQRVMGRFVKDFVSQNVENAWQYSKRYEEHDDYDAWLDWAERGYRKTRADRYPMGKGAVPLCSMLNGEELGYIEARKRIYVPLYSQAVMHTNDFVTLVRVARESSRDIWLKDFDGYQTADDFETILNNPKKKMGHAFVLKYLVERFL